MTSARIIVKPRDMFAKMNGTERAFALLMEARKRQGLMREWWFEKVTFKLADDTRYTPDFTVIENDGEMRFIETKGHWRDDALVKIKVAAEQFPFRFTAAMKSGDGFTYREFSSLTMPKPETPP